jgi:hypothetical protein
MPLTADPMPLYWLVYRHNNQISVVIEQGLMLILFLLLSQR